MNRENYRAGYKAGYYDAKYLGRTLKTALTSILPGYALGYRAGQLKAIIEYKKNPLSGSHPDQNPVNSYIGFHKGNRYEVYANTSYEAQQKIAKEHKIKKAYEITVILAEKDSKPVTHLPLFNPFSGSHPEMLPDAGHVVSLGNPRLVDSVRPGDRVTIVDRFGKQRTGRAVMRSSYGGWVLNMGGRYGTPGLADDSNIVKVSKSSRNPGAAWHRARNADYYARMKKEKSGSLRQAIFGELAANEGTATRISEAIGLPNPRPPKEWFTKMRRGVAKQYKRFGKARIGQITAGIWWKLPEATRKRLIRQYDNPFMPVRPYKGKLPDEVVASFPDEELGVLVNRRTGKVTNRWEDGTAGVPQSVKDRAAEETEAYDLQGRLYEWKHRNPTSRYAKKGIGFLGLAAIAGIAYLIWKNRSQ